jgi:uracil DNA glycosylase
VFFGRKAAEFSDLLPENQPKLFCSHPASAGYAGMHEWNCNDVFNKINDYLKSINKPEIKW